MHKFEQLVPGCVYHLYNRGINGGKIFLEDTNYEYFLRLYFKYMDRFSDTLALCLLPNHFHFLIKVHDPLIAYSCWKTRRGEPAFSQKIPDPSKTISNLFNAYAQAFNRRNQRTGALMERPFKRKIVDSELYFTRLVYYIHNNPVKHGLSREMTDYPWSSFSSIISFSPGKIKKDVVIGYFGSRSEFVDFHRQHHDLSEIYAMIREF